MTIFLIIGDNGSGKSTLKKGLVEQGYKGIVSATTREKRKGEQDGIDYHFVSQKDFDSLDLIEKNQFGGEWYGTPLSELEGEEEVYISVVEPNGAMQIKEYFKGDMRTKIFVCYLDIPLEDRKAALVSAGTGITEEEVDKRLSRGNIPEDLKLYQIKPDLIVKRFKKHLVTQVMEFLEIARRL